MNGDTKFNRPYTGSFQRQCEPQARFKAVFDLWFHEKDRGSGNSDQQGCETCRCRRDPSYLRGSLAAQASLQCAQLEDGKCNTNINACAVSLPNALPSMKSSVRQSCDCIWYSYDLCVYVSVTCNCAHNAGCQMYHGRFAN